MSFLSGSKRNLPAPAPRVGGFDETRTSTAEQARPVPWLCGRQRMGVTYLSQAFDQEAEEVERDVSKKDDPVVTGYNYYCSFAVLICAGPIDRVEKIYLDNVEVWSGSLARGVDGTDFVDITIEGVGDVRLYWGTDTQELDPTLEDLAEPNENGVIETHPAYRGQCWALFKRVFLGYQRTNVWNIEFVVARYPGTSLALGGELSGDINPVNAIVDALMDDRFGLGLPASRFDESGLGLVATRLETDGAGFSPMVTRRQPIRQLLVEMCEYFDLFHTTTAEGLFTMGFVRPTAKHAGTPVVSETALVSAPRLSPGGWEGTVNQVQVVFHNSTAKWKEDIAKGDDLGNLQATGEAKATTLQRGWVTRPETAYALAYSAVRAMSLPGVSGSLSLRKSQIGGIEVGEVFGWSYGHWGICHQWVRATEITWPDPSSPVVEVAFKPDWGDFNAQYSLPNIPTPPETIVAEAVPFEHQAVLELPYLPGHARPRNGWVQFLAAKPTRQTVKFRAHRKIAEASYEAVQTLHRFCWHGVLDEDYVARGETIRREPLRVYIDSLDQQLPSVQFNQALNLELMMWVPAELGSYTPVTGFDWDMLCSCFDLTLVTEDVESGNLVVGRKYKVVGGTSIICNGETIKAGKSFIAGSDSYTETDGIEQVQSTGTYEIKLITNRLDTVEKNFPAGSPIWFIPKRAIAPYSLETEAWAQTWKLQPQVLGALLPLEEATEIETWLIRRARKVMRPANLRVFGSKRNPRYSTGQNVLIEIDPASQELAPFFDRFNGGGVPELHWHLNFVPADGVGGAHSATLLSAATTTYTLTNGQILSFWGVEKDFYVECSHFIQGVAGAIHFETILVRFV